MTMESRVKARVRDAMHWLTFVGSRYYCPLCERTAREFTPNRESAGQAVIDKYHILSMGARPHYRCPWCNSSDKERLVWAFLLFNTDILTTERPISVLHIAPEKNTMHRLKALPHVTYVSGDKFEGDVRYSDGRYGNSIELDVRHIPFKDDSFDMVLCNHVMEHVPEDIRGMKEIYRVLKLGGLAILQTPVSRALSHTIEGGAETDAERLEKFGQADHVRIYAEKEYVARLKSVGLNARAIARSEVVDHEKTKFWGLNTEEKIYYAEK
jgi:SAM-dependent methyltransferase